MTEDRAPAAAETAGQQVEAEPVGSELQSAEAARGNRAEQSESFLQLFRKLPRDITPTEWASPAARKMLLARLEQLALENQELREYRLRFHEKEKEAAILGVRLRGSNRFEFLYGLALAFDGALVSLGTWSYSTSALTGTVTLLTGVGLTAGAAIGRIGGRDKS